MRYALTTAILIVIFSALLFGFSRLSSNKSSVQQTTNPVEETKKENQALTTIIAENLEVPWGLAVMPNSDLLITERKGMVRLIEDGKLKDEPIATIQVKQIGESGLHGITIHPKFNDNNFVYLYYTYSGNGDNTLNRVSRFTFKDKVLTYEKIIVDKIPGAIVHDGGRIKFGPDGYLYITTGDAQNPSLSQDKNSLAGKILRVTMEGKVEVYSYGHRNPQGITWDDKNRIWATEHGQSAQDEINLIEMGGNYGWPTIRGDEKQNGMVNPILQSGSDTWAPAGATFYKGSIFFGGLRGTALYQYIIDTKELKTHFKGEFGRIREVIIGPDNMLYITTSNKDGRGNPTPDDDKIIRVNPQKL